MKFTEDKCKLLQCGRQSSCAETNQGTAGSGGTVQCKWKMREDWQVCGCLNKAGPTEPSLTQIVEQPWPEGNSPGSPCPPSRAPFSNVEIFLTC